MTPEEEIEEIVAELEDLRDAYVMSQIVKGVAESAVIDHFSHGIPITWLIGRDITRIYPDGRVEVIKTLNYEPWIKVDPKKVYHI